MRENSFYIDTIKNFRDRRYEFKGLVKKCKVFIHFLFLSFFLIFLILILISLTNSNNMMMQKHKETYKNNKNIKN